MGLEEIATGLVRVWFFHGLLGAFLPGRDDSVEPIAAPEPLVQAVIVALLTGHEAALFTTRHAGRA